MSAMENTNTMIEWLEEFRGNDLDELCNATEEAIVDGNGFGWRWGTNNTPRQ